MRRNVRALLLLPVLLGGLLLTGCDSEQMLEQIAEEGIRQATQPGASQTQPPPARNSDTVRVATFNIQVFGKSKSSKPQVMEVLADVVRRFDVVAIQEIRSKDQSIIPRFVDLINSAGVHYDSVLGPRLGRTSSKEQYAYIFDTTRLEVVRGSVYTVSDPEDRLHREPLVSRFRVRGPPSREALSFTLVNIHTDPDETDTELDALDDVFRTVMRNGSGEDDVILLGDLNVDVDELGELGRVRNIVWTVSDVPTNTRRTKTYDNILFDREKTIEFTGRSGVLDLMAEYDLTEDQALDVSDHLPVWAEFRAYESEAGQLAGRPGTRRR